MRSSRILNKTALFSYQRFDKEGQPEPSRFSVPKGVTFTDKEQKENGITHIKGTETSFGVRGCTHHDYETAAPWVRPNSKGSIARIFNLLRLKKLNVHYIAEGSHQKVCSADKLYTLMKKEYRFNEKVSELGRFGFIQNKRKVGLKTLERIKLELRQEKIQRFNR